MSGKIAESIQVYKVYVLVEFNELKTVMNEWENQELGLRRWQFLAQKYLMISPHTIAREAYAFTIF